MAARNRRCSKEDAMPRNPSCYNSKSSSWLFLFLPTFTWLAATSWPCIAFRVGLTVTKQQYSPQRKRFIWQSHIVFAKKKQSNDEAQSEELNFDGGGHDSDDEYDFAQLSDEELLLACRSFLQKKNKNSTNWTNFQKRKAMRKQQQDLSKESASGFFWEDPTELKFYRQNTNLSTVTEDFSDPLRDDEISSYGEEDWDDSSAITQQEQVFFEFPGKGENNNLVQAARKFSTFPTRPSPRRVRQSEAAKSRWNDSEWRAQWYEQRWGSKERETRRKPGLKDRLDALTLDFLSSQQFTNLTEAEIVQAAQNYAQANQRRARSRKAFLKERRAALRPPRNEKPIASDALAWDRDPVALQEARRQRADRSRKAYQTRLKNSSATSSTVNKRKKVTVNNIRVPQGDTPKDALMRVEADLDNGKLPCMNDLELICCPKKLAKRRDLLQRLLREKFDLRGKCVPTDGAFDNLQFVTTCAIDDLMAFVLDIVRTEVEKDGK